jgi:hypothetical protein
MNLTTSETGNEFKNDIEFGLNEAGCNVLWSDLTITEEEHTYTVIIL